MPKTKFSAAEIIDSFGHSAVLFLGLKNGPGTGFDQMGLPCRVSKLFPSSCVVVSQKLRSFPRNCCEILLFMFVSVCFGPAKYVTQSNCV